MRNPMLVCFGDRVSNLVAGIVGAILVLAVCYLVFGGGLPFGSSPYVLKATFTAQTDLHLGSPVRIAGVNVVRGGKNRRAKLYYLRDRVGKATRLKEIKNEAAVKTAAPVAAAVATQAPEKQTAKE